MRESEKNYLRETVKLYHEIKELQEKLAKRTEKILAENMADKKFECSFGSIVKKEAYTQRRFDSAKFGKENPELKEAYMKDVQVKETLNIR